MRTERPITIAGAGPAGLTAAINLAKTGYDVIIYEKNSDVGLRHNGQLQGFDNWTFQEDTLNWLRKSNILINFDYYPLNEVTSIFANLNKYKFISKEPLGYIIKRGNEKGALDKSLYNQTINCGVEIKFNNKIDLETVDIIATGPPKALALASGINFNTNLPNVCWAVYNNNLVPLGYSYLISINGMATIASATRSDFKNIKKYLNETINLFKKALNFEIKNDRPFTGIAHFNPFIKFSKIMIGEAGGFQDAFGGFGMKYAILTGHLAAKSIIEKKDFNSLIKKEITPYLYASLFNRYQFEKSSMIIYKRALEKLSSKNIDIREFMYKVYKPSFLKNLLFYNKIKKFYYKKSKELLNKNEN